jgi:hypothetical protein
MARDPRKNSAFDSGMRGREKPKVQSGNTGGDRGARGPDGSSGGESVQEAGKTIGDPNGIDHMDSAYSSGMRGMEKPKQKGAESGANKEVQGPEVAGNRQEGDSHIGEPRGEESWSPNDRGPKKGVNDGQVRGTAEDAYKMGNDGNAVNSSEEAALGHEPQGEGILGEEDDTHINIRIPKASLKKKASGLQTN